MSNDERYGLTVTVESVLEPTGETVRKEFDIGTFTDVKDRYVLIDEDGEGRLMVTADELAELGGAKHE
jgi:hypothetical protein